MIGWIVGEVAGFLVGAGVAWLVVMLRFLKGMNW